jgi:hypothetical protein
MAGADVGRRHRQRVQRPRAQVALDHAPRDVLDHEALEAAGVEDAAVAIAGRIRRWRRGPHQLGGARQVADLEPDQLLEPQREPVIDEPVGLARRVLHRRRQERGVDGADAGPGDDVDGDVPAEPLVEALAQVADDAGLVGAARTAAGKDDADLAAGLEGLHAPL